MDISKRAFLRGAGAVVATGAPVVAGAATQGASAIASGAGLVSALSAAERKARAAMALAKHGGFPASEIIRVVSYDEYRALTSEGGQTEKNGGGLQIASALFGSGRPPRAVGRHRPGKIDLADTQYLMDAIRRLRAAFLSGI